MPCSLDGARRALLLALAILLAAFAAPAGAAPLTGSAFDTGDGDQADAIGLDWQGALAAGRVKESPDANDDCFVGGVKELSPNQWAFDRSAGGCTPGKSNLRVAFANPESAAATTFGHFAFFRNDTTGNSFLTFELNQRATSWTNATGTTIPCRSTGDLLLSFEVGGSSLTTSLYRWTGDGSGPAACPDGAAGTFTGSGTIPAGRFQGAMNAGAATANFVNPAKYGATFPANSYGEAAIDIPAVLASMGASPCFGFLQMQVHSRSSSSISSAMIDYTTPVPVHIQSCAVIGTQYQDSDGDGSRDAGEPGLSGFRMYADLDDDGVRDTGEPSGVSDADGFYRILGVPAGSTRIRQEARAGWRCSAPSPCAYTRTLTTGGNSTGNDFGALGPSTASGTAFDDLDADGVRDGGEPALAGAVHYADLDDDGVLDAGEPSAAAGADGAFTILDVPAGLYRIRQATPASWTCSAPAPCSSLQSFSSGSSVTGLVFGAYAPASLAGQITEQGVGAIAGAQVYLDANGNDAFDVGERQTTTDAGGLYTFTGLVPGAYTVRVTRPATWFCATVCELTSTLTSGQLAGGRDLAYLRAATVSGTVFDDANNNGLRDAGESGLAGFTQWVDLDGDAALDAGEPSAVSDSAGAYAITGVRPGAWTLRQAPNGAYACTRPVPCTYALSLASGATVAARDFGDYVSRSVSGTVFNDANRSAALDAGEAGLAGWTVFSDENSDGSLTAGEPSATTNSLGQYNITGLANGNYRIRVVVQATWTCSTPTPTTTCTNTGSIGSGQSDAGKNFGFWGPSTIRGTLFEDLDGDGAAREPGEPGLPGRTVFADRDGDGVLDADERSATSDAGGDYAITGVDPGSYTVRQVLPGGWTCTQPAPCTYAVATATSTLTGRDFGSRTTASIAGVAFEDLDADGEAREGGEGGLSGRTVFLDTDADGVADAGEPVRTTDATGAYSFTGLVPGTYRVRQVLPSGWEQSAPAGAHLVTATSGGSATGRDLASFTTGSIAGVAFEDADFDGSAREGGDTGLSGRTLYVDADGDGARDGGEPTATTDGTGAYAFAGLRPGTYTVRPVMPAGWACAFPSDCAATATVASRATVADRDFGGYVGASVSGVVFADADADGAAREAGEDGLGGRRVFLDGDADAIRDAGEPTTLTAADGTYAFTGITARAWQLRLELPTGFTCDRPAPCVRDLALSSGADRSGEDFGVHTTGTIAGHLFTDRDADGAAQTFGENDQPERTVFLDADGDGTHDAGERSTTTDDVGAYVFTGVEPGPYRVAQVLPAGWSCSTPNPCRHDVVVRSGEDVTGRDFSSWTTASFTGTYFEDEDGDGDYPEPADGGVAGRTVYLDLDDDATRDGGEPATTTAGDGRFSFTGLTPDAYVVRAATQPAGWTCSYPTPCATRMTLEANERAQDVNFGVWTNGTVAGTVVRDGDDAPLSGRTVFADLDGDATADAGEPAATTGAGGGYTLSLAPGAYTIRQVTPSGWTCAAPSPCAHAVGVTSQSAIANRDFASAQGAFLSGTVFDDADGDGTRDAGEDPVEGASVSTGGGTPATTGADGGYALPAAAGPHTVTLTVPAGFACGAPTGCAHTRTLGVGESAGGLDFAVWRPASVSGTVREDLDADGSPESTPLPGRTVFADLDADGEHDTGEPSAVTGADGAYTLPALPPGPHRIRLLGTPGSTCSAPAPCRRDVTLTSGAAATGADFAAWRDASIAGVVADDTDGDGTRDAGEPGAAGLTVFVDLDGDGTRDAGEPHATTSAAGAYALGALKPGTHAVRVALPSDRRCAAGACAADVTVASGATATRHFATWRPSTIAGTVFEDRAGRPALANREVYVDADADGTRDAGEPTATTNAAGAYALTGLAPGTHAVRVTVAAGWRCTTPDPCAASVATQSASTPAGPDFGLIAVTADLGVTLRRDTAELVAGRAARWTARVTNAGPVTADGATLTLTIPDGLRDVTWTPPAGVTCARAGQTITCALGDLAVGATPEIRLDATVAPDRGGSTLDVDATVRGTQPDPQPANDADDDAPPVGAIADLDATATLPASADVGDVVDLVLTTTNAGPSDADEVVLVTTLPEGLEPVADRLPAGCTAAGRVVTCTLGDLAVGDTARRTIPVRVGPEAGGRNLTVPVGATSDTPDPTPADAEAEAALTAVPSADVQVQVGEPPHATDDGVGFGLTITNAGPSTATDVVLLDGPFPGARIVSVVTDRGTCTVEDDGRLRCELGDMPVGTEIHVTVVLALDEGTDPEQIELAPKATGNERDPAPADNTKTLSLPAKAAAPPAVERPATPTPTPTPTGAPALIVEAPPAATTCASVRAFDVKVRRRTGQRLRRVTMTLAGRPLKVVRRGGRFVARVDLRGRPLGDYVLRIRAVTRHGKVLRGARTYHTCAERRPDSVPLL